MIKNLLIIMVVLCALHARAADLFERYNQQKNKWVETYGIDFGLDTTLSWQQVASHGKKTLFRTFYTPYFNARLFENGQFHFLTNFVRFYNQTAAEASAKAGVANMINTYDANYNELLALYYTHQLGNFELGLGQIPICYFDGVTASDLQRQYFLNNAIAQNGTFTYPSSGLGGYVSAQITPDVKFSLGAIDAANPTAHGVHGKNLKDGKFSTFAAFQYQPIINGYQGSYSLLVYDKPSVQRAPVKSQGVSVYLAQDVSKQHSVFFRFDASSGDYSLLKHSYALGLLWNDPLKRARNDQFALAYTLNKVNKNAVDTKTYHAYEQTVETYYDYQLYSNISLRPDVQFYVNPAFRKKSTATAFTFSLYFKI